MLGIVAVGVVRESRKFSGHPCIGRIARSSLRQHSFLVMLLHLARLIVLKLCIYCFNVFCLCIQLFIEQHCNSFSRGIRKGAKGTCPSLEISMLRKTFQGFLVNTLLQLLLLTYMSYSLASGDEALRPHWDSMPGPHGGVPQTPCFVPSKANFWLECHLFIYLFIHFITWVFGCKVFISLINYLLKSAFCYSCTQGVILVSLTFQELQSLQ